MARLPKNNCDYFPHDANMRNHKKVKALRSKFGPNGYAVWSMVLEYLTGSDGNVFPYTDMEFELISGDFGISATEIRSIVDYCISMEMLFNKDGFISSESLDDRLAPVYAKRGKAKELSKQQQRVNGKFARNNTEPNGITVTEIPQKKVKESKVKESNKDLDDLSPQVIGMISEIRKRYHPKSTQLVSSESRLRMARRCRKAFDTAWPGRDFIKACRLAFEHKASNWWGTEQWQYFMPETLLTDKNFIKYIEEAANYVGPTGIDKNKAVTVRSAENYTPA